MLLNINKTMLESLHWVLLQRNEGDFGKGLEYVQKEGSVDKIYTG